MAQPNHLSHKIKCFFLATCDLLYFSWCLLPLDLLERQRRVWLCLLYFLNQLFIYILYVYLYVCMYIGKTPAEVKKNSTHCSPLFTSSWKVLRLVRHGSPFRNPCWLLQITLFWNNFWKTEVRLSGLLFPESSLLKTELTFSFFQVLKSYSSAQPFTNNERRTGRDMGQLPQHLLAVSHQVPGICVVVQVV